MITLDLESNNYNKVIKIKDDILFNAILFNHPDIIKRIIKSIKKRYFLNDAFFCIINDYVDFSDDGVSIYPGLIVRTDQFSYAVLYLEDTEIDEDYLVETVKNHINSLGNVPKNSVINIYKFAVSKTLFLKLTKKIK